MFLINGECSLNKYLSPSHFFLFQVCCELSHVFEGHYYEEVDIYKVGDWRDAHRFLAEN